MFDRKLSTALTGGIFMISLMLSSQAMAAFTAKEASELDTKAAATQKDFMATAKGADGVFANGKGILVCPKIRKLGLGVGAERGECVLTKGAEGKLYYVTTGLKAGAIIGMSSHSMILVLNTDEVLAKFTSGEREWEFGIDASVAVAKMGVGGDLDTTNLKKDIVSFIFGEKGLMADLSWEGSRFKKLDVE